MSVSIHLGDHDKVLATRSRAREIVASQAGAGPIDEMVIDLRDVQVSPSFLNQLLVEGVRIADTVTLTGANARTESTARKLTAALGIEARVVIRPPAVGSR